MSFQKVIIIGSPGAGKSTFARKLRDITGLPLHYLDIIYHKPDRTTVSREEFDAKLREILLSEKWIIDGNYQRTIECRMRECDTVFLLDYPVEQCLEGAQERVGRKREEMPWVEETLDEEFRQFILEFRQTNLPKIYTLLEKYKVGREIVIFKSRAEAENWLEERKENI